MPKMKKAHKKPFLTKIHMRVLSRTCIVYTLVLEDEQIDKQCIGSFYLKWFDLYLLPLRL
jgi:hypothetical protein